MKDETKTSESPTCACGRVDLYDEWLKQNEKEESPATSSQADIPDSSSSEKDEGDQKPKHTPKGEK